MGRAAEWAGLEFFPVASRRIVAARPVIEKIERLGEVRSLRMALLDRGDRLFGAPVRNAAPPETAARDQARPAAPDCHRAAFGDPGGAGDARRSADDGRGAAPDGAALAARRRPGGCATLGADRLRAAAHRTDRRRDPRAMAERGAVSAARRAGAAGPGPAAARRCDQPAAASRRRCRCSATATCRSTPCWCRCATRPTWWRSWPRRCRRIDYPPEKLDVLFVVETRSLATVAAVQQELADPRFELVLVPDALPRTKPKALELRPAAGARRTRRGLRRRGYSRAAAVAARRQHLCRLSRARCACRPNW